MMKKEILIIGPTASGKTSLSVKLAKMFNMDVINADSTQVYKYHNIGTAKITIDETNGVKHHLIDIVEPDYNYTVYDFQKDLRNLLDNKDMPYIICGGSSFYIKSALYDYIFEDEDNIIYPDYNTMVSKIKDTYKNIEIDFNNTRRVQTYYRKAINNIDLESIKNINNPLYDLLIIYIDLDREVQENIFRKRIYNQIEKGYLREVKYLDENNLTRYDILGYLEISDYLKGLTTLDECVDKIVKKTLKLSKKQKTFFLNQFQNVNIIKYDDCKILEKSIFLIEEFLKK